ncbi:TIGR00282 family metallophosphoesterase [Mycoplasma nasistruthionis]|uniref:YmdB family metallophosphoesterase n=1 Tax=Mycoplasma nasistruthionis TaxID=353852 RepID=A0A5B7XVL7_9MOLU|nr:TIGR00282 family metallophosphoesterase [Mycoplasma nasistruthionis]QCZ36981.1 YmdB family metallophosphoesterase [Mycoplasma nasistruthionis]
MTAKNEQFIKLLFIGDIFGEPGILTVEKLLPKLIKQYSIDFTIAQGENITGRKGLNFQDYNRLKKVGINVFTMGNHVYANADIYNFIDTEDVIRPFNVPLELPGFGTRVYKVKDFSLRVTSLMGIAFNELLQPWPNKSPENFFDAFDVIENNMEQTDFHFIDFHGETTSEKNVFGIYVDGKVDAVCGTHTHVQTNDARLLPNNTAYVTDAGMTGPMNSAIGANYDEVYQKMRFEAMSKFKVSPNPTQFNAVVLELHKDKTKNKIDLIKIEDIDYKN